MKPNLLELAGKVKRSEIISSSLSNHRNIQKCYRSEKLTIRALMAGKDVGTIIGLQGEKIRMLRSRTGCRVNISDGLNPERIVAVSGTLQQVSEAFERICKTFEQYNQLHSSRDGREPFCPPITLRLLIPSALCGSLIGRGGNKIKHLRESTGASVQVASDTLPNSFDRTITITGSSRAVTLCVHHVCLKLLRLRSKHITVPYQPQVLTRPSQLFSLPSQQNLPCSSGSIEIPVSVEFLLNLALYPSLTFTNCNLIRRSQLQNQPFFLPNSLPPTISESANNPSGLSIEPFFYGFPAFKSSIMSTMQSNLLQVSCGAECNNMNSPRDTHNTTGFATPKIMISNDMDQLKTHVIRSQLQSSDANSLFSEASTAVCQSLLSAAQAGLVPNHNNQAASIQHLLSTPMLQTPNQLTILSYPKAPVRLLQSVTQHKAEMYLPNDLVGCIIGRGGNKINEIRQTSQANIKISSGEEGLSERRITITGSFPAVQTAQTMINNSILSRELIVPIVQPDFNMKKGLPAANIEHGQ